MKVAIALVVLIAAIAVVSGAPKVCCNGANEHLVPCGPSCPTPCGANPCDSPCSQCVCDAGYHRDSVSGNCVPDCPPPSPSPCAQPSCSSCSPCSACQNSPPYPSQ